MSEFLSKFENFIFDVMGLIFPGIFFLLLFAGPVFLFDFDHFSPTDIDNSVLLSSFSIVFKAILKLQKLDISYSLGLGVLAAYILGHVIKVFSIIAYDIFESIFDENINEWVAKKYAKWLGNLVSWVKRISSNNSYLKFIYKAGKKLFSPFKKIIIKIFTFRSPDYFKDNEALVTKSVQFINAKLSLDFPTQWYSLFKFSVAVNSQENLKSLSGNFLSKYNMYRSLAFIFGMAIPYFLLLYDQFESKLPKHLGNQKMAVILCLILLWFTFHVKYKRYWTLCGNENLISLFYFLHKKQLNS